MGQAGLTLRGPDQDKAFVVVGPLVMIGLDVSHVYQLQNAG